MQSIGEKIKNTESNGIIELCYGWEYAEQIVISSPLTIRSLSSAATIVGPSPTVVICSRNVQLENLHLVSNDEEGICLSVDRDCGPCFKDVFIKGKVKGLEGEDGEWELPSVLDFGRLKPNTAHKTKISLLCPVAAVIHTSAIPFVHCSPDRLEKGISEIEITVEEVLPNTLISGDIFIETIPCHLKRRISLIGNTLHSDYIPFSGENEYLWECPAARKEKTAIILPEAVQYQWYEYFPDISRYKGHHLRIQGLPAGLYYETGLFPAVKGSPEKYGEFDIVLCFEKEGIIHKQTAKLNIMKSEIPLRFSSLKTLPEGSRGKKYEYVISETDINCKGWKLRMEGLPKGIFFENRGLFPTIKGIPEQAGEYRINFVFEKDHQIYKYSSVLKINN